MTRDLHFARNPSRNRKAAANAPILAVRQGPVASFGTETRLSQRCHPEERSDEGPAFRPKSEPPPEGSGRPRSSLFTGHCLYIRAARGSSRANPPRERKRPVV